MRSSGLDSAKRKFETDLLRELGAITRLPQQTVLRIAREHAEELLALYNGECSGKQAAIHLKKTIDWESERDQFAFSASAGWRWG